MWILHCKPGLNFPKLKTRFWQGHQGLQSIVLTSTRVGCSFARDTSTALRRPLAVSEVRVHGKRGNEGRATQERKEEGELGRLERSQRGALGRACSLQKLSDEVLVRLSVWSEVQIVCILSSWCHCIPKPNHLLPHLNPDWFYLSGTGLPRVTWKGAVKQVYIQLKINNNPSSIHSITFTTNINVRPYQ